ncbi:MAG: acetyl-CoA decarbonylase/synthase complex subunit delta [bacterium]|nr:acetyl-CoA decarbonylase/synthase complex subunit delta [bacterium]
MSLNIPLEKYTGSIRETIIGGSNKAVKIGGESVLAFHKFEGNIPNKPLVALGVCDIKPTDWAEAAIEPFKDCLDNPTAWAKKCVEEYGADVVCIELLGTDPNGENKGPEEAAEVVKGISENINVPLIIYGSGKSEKDTAVLKKVAEACQGKNVLIGASKEDNYRSVGAACLGYKHSVIAETPIDVNLAKQLNILLNNLGLPMENIVIDPSTGALGYGIEYTYSVIERDRLAALTQSDEKMQVPIICNLGKDSWKTKESKISQEEMPSYGDVKKRGIMWEAVGAMSLFVAGANVVVMRHPEAAKLVKTVIEELL